MSKDDRFNRTLIIALIIMMLLNIFLGTMIHNLFQRIATIEIHDKNQDEILFQYQPDVGTTLDGDNLYEDWR